MSGHRAKLCLVTRFEIAAHRAQVTVGITVADLGSFVSPSTGRLDRNWRACAAIK